jgi:two-component sensor histidine kinase
MSSLERIQWPRQTVQASSRGPDSSLDFRQLRHQTKNALQRLIVQINQQPTLQTASSSRALADDLERRICLSVSISDALFGLARMPAPLDERLRALGEAMVQLLAKPEQVIQLSVHCEGACPDHLADAVLRIAHEMISNAIKHGMEAVQTGAIMVTLTSPPGGPTTLVVRDDGWGPVLDHPIGEGHAIMSDLAEALHGQIALSRRGPWTEASATFPPDETATSQAEPKKGPPLMVVLVMIAAMAGAAYLGLTYLNLSGVMKHAGLYADSAILLAESASPVQTGL